MSEPRAPGRPPAIRWVILGLIVLAQTVANIGPLGIPAIASLIRADLGLTLAQAGSFLSAYYIGPVTMSLFGGVLADRWGTARTLVLGQAIIALGLLAASAAPSYGVFIALLIVAGVGYGLLNPASTTAAMSWFPPRQRATVVGLKQVGLPFGGMLGAATLPALALTLGWRWAIVASALAIAVCALACAIIYRDPPGEAVARRVAGARSPIRTVLRTRDLWLVAVATAVFAAMQTVWMAFLALYLQGVVGLSLLAASRYLALAQGGGVLGRVAFGLLSDRVFAGRRRTPLAIAGCTSALCSVALAFTGPATSAAWLAALALLFGFAGIGWNGVQHTLMAELAGPGAAATAVGLGLAVSSAGVMLGPVIFGWLVQSAGGYRGPWLLLAVSMAAGLAVLALVRERRGPL
ncbi:MAG TPA: MFS transporter [Candidatus Binatia bacterium]|nr:MFS transporter [Candidatus Binatia bacterium]